MCSITLKLKWHCVWALTEIISLTKRWLSVETNTAATKIICRANWIWDFVFPANTGASSVSTCHDDFGDDFAGICSISFSRSFATVAELCLELNWTERTSKCDRVFKVITDKKLSTVMREAFCFFFVSAFSCLERTMRSKNAFCYWSECVCRSFLPLEGVFSTSSPAEEAQIKKSFNLNLTIHNWTEHNALKGKQTLNCSHD